MPSYECTAPQSEGEFDEQIEDNPVDQLSIVKSQMAAMDARRSDDLCRMLQRSAKISAKILENSTAMTEFYQLEFWKESKYERNPDNNLLHCVQYIFNAPLTTSPRYKSASRCAKAVGILLDEGFRVNEIYAELKACGGPYGLLKTQENTDSKQPDADECVLESEEPDEKDDQGAAVTSSPPQDTLPIDLDLDLDAIDASSPVNHESDGSKKNRKIMMFDKKTHLAVEDEGFRSEFFKMYRKERKWVLIERVANEGSVLRYKIMGMEDEEN